MAIEVGGSIGHGLLTFALVKEGLEQAADFKPRDQVINLKEWLEYGVVHVPNLYNEILAGRLRGINRAELVGSVGRPSYQQQPSLFDFSRKDPKVLLTQAR